MIRALECSQSMIGVQPQQAIVVIENRKTHEATILEESPYDPKNELLRA